jgi:hypothetical protein
VRRKYNERRQITVYLDLSEYDRLRTKAGGEGRISEWARETLLGELETNHAELPKAKVVWPSPRVHVARRGAHAPEGLRAEAAPISMADGGSDVGGVAEDLSRKGKTCKHGTSKGHNCWQCGGMAVIE